MDNTSDETWATCPERPTYKISSLGRVAGPRGIRRPKASKDGYQRIILNGGPQLTRTVHSLVAAAFLGPRPPASVVAHKNGVRNDNRLENLQYTSYHANSMHQRMLMKDGAVCPLLRTIAGRMRIDERRRGKMAKGEHHGMAKLSPQTVLDMHAMYLAGGKTMADVGAAFGIGGCPAADILSGRRWRHLHPDVTLHR